MRTQPCIAVILHMFALGFSHRVIAGSAAERINLATLTSVQVEVGPIPAWVESHGTTRAKLRSQIDAILHENHLKITDIMDENGGVLDLSIAVITSTKPSAYVYVTRLMLGQRIRLSNTRFSYATTWEDSDLGASDNPAKSAALIVDSVHDSLEKFVDDFDEAHAKSEKPDE